MNLDLNTYHQVIEPYITGMTTTCSYCNHLSPLILQEGKHTYITLAIGQIVGGYVQVCTQKHRTAATGLYPEETEELVAMKTIVRNAYEETYGCRGIAFEHGQAGSCQWGHEAEANLRSLCHHMHIHLVPVNIDIRHRITEYFPEHYVVDEISGLKRIREEELDGGPYLYFEDCEAIGYVYPTRDKDVPRQFLRSCVAEELHVGDRADWASVPGIEYFADSKARLQPIMRKYFREILG